MRPWLRCGLLLWTLVPTAAIGGETLSPDEEVARRRHAEGERAYARGDYAAAIAAFEAARNVLPLPAFDYNIARAYDRLGEFEKALTAYERFISAQPTTANAAEIRARIQVLRARTASVDAATAERPAAPARSRYLVPGVLAGVSGATLIVGAGLLGAAASRYGELRDGCGITGLCGAEVIAPVRGLDYAGKALLGVGSAVLVVDLALWGVAARGARR